MADYTIGNQRVTNPDAIRALEKLGVSPDGDNDFSEAELGQLLDAHHPSLNHIDENDRYLLAERASALTESEFTALVREYREHFPRGAKTIDVRLFESRPSPAMTEPNQELGWVDLAEPIEIDVDELAEHIPFSSSEKIHDMGHQITALNGRTILWFQPATGGGFDRIYSPLTRAELVGWLAGLPEDQRTELSQLLNLPPIDAAILENHTEAALEMVSDWDFLQHHLELPHLVTHSVKEVPGPPQHLARGIAQRAYGVTDAGSDQPVLGTSGLGPCIAVTFYHEGVAALAHVDSMTDTDSLRDMLDTMGIEPGTPGVEVRLIGGEPSSRWLAIRILRSLQELGLEPTQADIIDKPHPSQLAIDARTGEVYYGYSPFDTGPEEPEGDPDLSFTLRKEFDGRGDGAGSDYRAERLARFNRGPQIPDFTFRQETEVTEGSHHYVDIGHGALSSSDILYTNGMWPCVGVAILNRTNNSAILLHASAPEDVERVLPHLLLQMGVGEIEAVIAGGDGTPGSRETLYRILLTLDDRHIPVVGHRPNDSGIDSLAVDPSTGTFF